MLFFFFKQKTAYEMRIRDWSSDVCSSDLGRLDLGRIDQALVDAYARHLRDDPARRPVIVGQLLQVVTDLYHLRDHLPDGGLGFEPWAGRAAARVAGYRHVRENRTPRMPEEIVTPLLAGSLRYITTFATDILAAREIGRAHV